MSKKRLAIGLAAGSLAACIGCCNPLGEEAEEAEEAEEVKEQQIERSGHPVVPVPPEIEATRTFVKGQYKQNRDLRAAALQADCRYALDAQKCVEDYTLAHLEDEPATDQEKATPESEAPTAPSTTPTAEPASAPPSATTEPPEAATTSTATSTENKTSKPINPESLFTATQNGIYHLEDGTVLDGKFEGSESGGTFTGSITKPNKNVLRARAFYTEQGKGGWTGWMQAPDFVVRPYGPAVVTYSDQWSLAFSFKDDKTGEVDYTKAADHTVGDVTSNLNVFEADSNGQTWPAWWHWGATGDPSLSCEPYRVIVTLDKNTLEQKTEPWGDAATTRTDCPAQ